MTRSFKRHAIAALLCCLSLQVCVADASATSNAPQATAGTDGPVLAVTRLGNTIYLGGNFTHVGTPTGSWAAFSTLSAAIDSAMPKIAGTSASSLIPGVFAEVSDGAGGWYIGGNFASVGGLPRNGLAHIRADRTVDPGFNPNVGGQVSTIAVSGSTVYFGGLFATVNGSIARHLAAAVNATTGVATSWNPNPNSNVDALAVSGSAVYMGGAFTTVNGSIARKYAAAVDPANGALLSWNPNITNGFAVYSLVVSGSTVYLGGDFSTINGSTTRNFAAAVDATNATVDPWNPNLSLSVLGGRVLTMVVSPTTVYLGGIFDHVNGGTIARNDLASVDPTTGTANPTWDPQPDNNVKTMSLSGNTLYIGGDLTAVHGSARGHLAAVDATTGTPTPWNPNVAGGTNSSVYALAVSGSNVGAGGTFSFVSPQARNHLAAIDATTGQLLSWDPNTDQPVAALAASGSTVYAGGSFTTVNGSTMRRDLAAFDATTGTHTSWDPEPNNSVSALAVSGGTVYAGGSFSMVNAGATPRHHVAAFDSTGTATAWNPDTSDTVNTLAVLGSTVYLGGDFTTINGPMPRNHLAAVDATNGTANSWDPNTDLRVTTLAAAGSTVYVGGDFTTVNTSTPRSHAAAFDATSGTVTGWNPHLSGSSGPSALAALGSAVYIGGAFTTVNGLTPRAHLASFDATTGTVTSWDPSPDSQVDALAVAPDGTVYAGGSFTTFPTVAQPYFAAFSPTTVGPPSPPSCSTLSKNVVYQTATTISFSCSSSTPGALRYSIVAQPTHGTLSSLDATHGTVFYTPAAGYSGQDSFTYQATDGNSDSTPATVHLTVAAPGLATVLSTSAPLMRCTQPFRRLVSHQSGALRISGSLRRAFAIADGRGTIVSVKVKGTAYTFTGGRRVLTVTNVSGAVRVTHKSRLDIELRSSDGRVAITVSYNAKHGTRVVAKVKVCTFSAARNQIVGVAGGHKPTGRVYLLRTTGAPLTRQTVTITDAARTITLHTGSDGTAAFTLATGPDRGITLAYAGDSTYQSALLTVPILNHGYGTIHLTTRRLPAHGLAVFRGKAFGRDGKPVSLPTTVQYLTSRGRWRTVAKVRSTHKGNWSAKIAWPRHGHAGLRKIYYRVIVDRTPSRQINALLP